MALEEVTREKWATRLGFILAAVGSAVGLGNIWRFPFQVGQEGGAAFLVMYLLFVAIIGIPAMLVEFVVGRSSERNPINAFDRLGHGEWRFIGILGVITGFLILSYYSVVAGWVTRYTFASLTGAYFGEAGAYFGQISAGPAAVGFHALFMVVTAVIVAAGIQKGIEMAVKVMVPALLVLLVGLIAYAFTLEGAAQGYEYYLSPDFGVIAANWTSILPAAAGQAFFTLSLGMGVMITYASYIDEDRNLGVDGGWIAFLNTLVSILAGLVVFPVLFTIGTEPGSGGPGELFAGVGGAIAQVPGSRLVGFLFFGVVTIAALSSAISILEVLVSYAIDNYSIERPTATAVISAIVFVVGIPSAMSTDVLTLFDATTAQLLLPLGVFLTVIFVGWVYQDSAKELAKGTGSDASGTLPVLWLWYVRIPILIVVGFVLVINATELYGTLTDMLL
ncbi:neurotransmitter:Na+ symporter, NSS family [Natronoarchaeum philippinense]|uniref:Neurotransmitter:Na+ symporter, NSS family n=1 Tax=Natronoarchaeum philippinense TaxID=558529 RepID=A0A285NAM8_NATPI|nr:sodium-dependent transporter [Natronoarchaeum philippinense]SNZ05016.1 neurotransmitter:Na+ symporter, NSS family [Natronoarchaeum philippinense]